MKTVTNADELNVLAYEYTDKVIAHMNKHLMRLFESAKGQLVNMDAADIIEYIIVMFDDIEHLAEVDYLKIAKQVYTDNGGLDNGEPDSKWVRRFFESYNPVTKVVFENELERKRERFAENIIAVSAGGSNGFVYSSNAGASVNGAGASAGEKATAINAEIDSQLRNMSRFLAQGATDITDASALQAYEDRGVSYVQWKTCTDERRCADCKELHNQVFPITAIPPKPHMRCRCWIVPYNRSEKT